MRKNAVCADGKYFVCNSTTPNFCYQRIFDYESCTKINGRGIMEEKFTPRLIGVKNEKYGVVENLKIRARLG